jgi:hypothetical protein
MRSEYKCDFNSGNFFKVLVKIETLALHFIP